MLDFSKLPKFKNRQFELVSLIAEWATVYQVPLEAIERQIGIAHAWCSSNPKRAPKKDCVRFLNNWMRLARERGSLNVTVSRPLYQEPKAEDEVMSGDDWARIKAAIKPRAA